MFYRENTETWPKLNFMLGLLSRLITFEDTETTRLIDNQLRISAQNMTYKYEFDGCGLRYMIAEFASLIQRGERKSKMLTPKNMININRVLLEYNERKLKEQEQNQ